MHVSIVMPYHTVLVTIVLYYSLKPGSIMPPALFLFFNISLASGGFLWLHKNFSIVCSVSVESATRILIEITLNLQIIQFKVLTKEECLVCAKSLKGHSPRTRYYVEHFMCVHTHSVQPHNSPMK